MDHLNINHEKGRHDWLKAFYFDFLRCTPDPRKSDNLNRGSKTLWANLGSHQFHLPEGTPHAQVVQGIITLAYPDLEILQKRYRDNSIQQCLAGSKFHMSVAVDSEASPSFFLAVTDPWGNAFRIVTGDEETDVDTRGRQPGGKSEGLAWKDLTLYTSANCNFPGIARFYERILMAPILEVSDTRCVVSVGPHQTLSFVPHPDGRTAIPVPHEDLRDDPEATVPPDGGNRRPTFPSNYGPHISIYVADLSHTYRNAESLGVLYVNPRFKRQAYTLEEAQIDCMFRCFNIVDPDRPENGAILRLEHEIRSVVKPDGTKYKSCPFDVIPDCIKGLT